VWFAWFGVWPLLLLQGFEYLLEILAELVNGNGFVRDGRGRRRKEKELLEGTGIDAEFRSVGLHELLESLGRSREREDRQIALDERLNDGRDEVRGALETADYSIAAQLLPIVLGEVERGHAGPLRGGVVVGLFRVHAKRPTLIVLKRQGLIALNRSGGVTGPLRALLSIPVLRNRSARRPAGEGSGSRRRRYDSFRASIDNACSGRWWRRISFFLGKKLCSFLVGRGYLPQKGPGATGKGSAAAATGRRW